MPEAANKNNDYIPIMIQSLKKKKMVLATIASLNLRQRDELDDPNLDPEDFDKTVQEKAKCIDELDALDEGFQNLYDRVKEELNRNREAHKEEIAQMQALIREITEKSASIQVQETRNKAMMEQKFATVRKQVREVRTSQKIVNQYYKNMMKTNFVEPQFTDNKK
jgi:regulator of sigma D